MERKVKTGAPHHADTCGNCMRFLKGDKGGVCGCWKNHGKRKGEYKHVERRTPACRYYLPNNL